MTIHINECIRHMTDPTALTPREKQIAGLIAQGYNDFTICRILGLKEKSIISHATHIYAKMHARYGAEDRNQRVYLSKVLPDWENGK